MTRLPLLALLFLAATTAAAETLTTTFAGGNGNAGIMYDVVADKPVSISAIQFASDAAGAGTLEIYTKAGTHVGSEGTASDWTLVVSAPFEAGAADAARAPIVFPNPLLVPPGETLAFYIRQTAGSLSFTSGDGVGTTEADDGSLRILEGTGISFLFGVASVSRIPNVTMHYFRIPDVLTTTFNVLNFNKGIMFDVIATNTLTVEALQFPINGGAGPFVANLYSKANTHVAFETDPSARSLVASLSVNVAPGGSNTVLVSLPAPISISQGATRAFFIHSPDGNIR